MDKRSLRKLASFALAGVLALALLSPPARSDSGSGPEFAHAPAVTAQNGMVVAQEALAARVGADILQRGGNAVDAAVAVGFAMAVTYPRAGNLGGGGFMVLHRAGGEDTAIDYRETAPAAINDKSFLDAQGNADPLKSREVGARHRRAGHGRGPRFRRGEIRVWQILAGRSDRAGDRAGARGHRCCRRHGGYTAALSARGLPAGRPRRKSFSKPTARCSRPATGCCSRDLADTLEAIAQGGPRAFYQGPIAQKSPPPCKPRAA